MQSFQLTTTAFNQGEKRHMNGKVETLSITINSVCNLFN